MSGTGVVAHKVSRCRRSQKPLRQGANYRAAGLQRGAKACGTSNDRSEQMPCRICTCSMLLPNGT